MGNENTCTVMVINGVFEKQSMMIVKTNGTEWIQRCPQRITSEYLQEKLERKGIHVQNCKLVIVDSDWKGKLSIEEH